MNTVEVLETLSNTLKNTSKTQAKLVDMVMLMDKEIEKLSIRIKSIEEGLGI